MQTLWTWDEQLRAEALRILLHSTVESCLLADMTDDRVAPMGGRHSPRHHSQRIDEDSRSTGDAGGGEKGGQHV